MHSAEEFLTDILDAIDAGSILINGSGLGVVEGDRLTQQGKSVLYVRPSVIRRQIEGHDTKEEADVED